MMGPGDYSSVCDQREYNLKDIEPCINRRFINNITRQRLNPYLAAPLVNIVKTVITGVTPSAARIFCIKCIIILTGLVNQLFYWFIKRASSFILYIATLHQFP